MRPTYFIFALFLLLGVSGLGEEAPSRPIQEAATAISSGDDAGALAALRQVSPEEPRYPLVLLESARIFYRRGEWSKFFAVTGYLRTIFPKSAEASKVRVLESMALVRHCQYDRAETMLHGRTPVAGLEQKWQTAQSAIHHWLQALPKAKIARSTPEDATGKTKIFSETVEWPVKLDPAALTEFNPFDLRRPVISKCSPAARSAGERP